MSELAGGISTMDATTVVRHENDASKAAKSTCQFR
jgi:hypothetical protein